MRRHRTLDSLIDEILDDYESWVCFEELSRKDQNRLIAAYLRENPDTVLDILGDMELDKLAMQFADLVEVIEVPAYLVYDLRVAAQDCKAMPDLVNGCIDRRYRLKLDEVFA